jgi:cyanosortase A-associated protein
MTSSYSLYFPLLRLTFFCTLLVLGRAIFYPNLNQSSPFTFPDRVPLERSQFIERSAIVTKSFYPKYWSDLNSYQYHYQGFNVQIHYLQSTDGDVPTYLKNYLLNDQNIEVIDKKGSTGSYRLFERDRIAYLSACINSRGSSTINREQFFANRNTYDLRIDRLLPIVLGTEDPRDARCLWVTVSTPIENQSIEVVHQRLETAWQEIYAWWMPRFPKL